MDERKRRLKRGWILLLFAAVAITTVGGWWYMTRPLNFDGQRWQEARTDQEYEARYRMLPSIRRLMDSGQLNTREAIRQLLGTPEFGAHSEPQRMWLYNVGPEHGSLMRIDDDWLELVFDEQGTLISHRVRPD